MVIGAFGTVYKGVLEYSQQLVAVKVLDGGKKSINFKHVKRESLWRELDMSILAKDHPHIV